MNEKIMLNYDAATINKAIELALKQGTGGADSGTAVRRLDNYFKQSGYAMFKYKAYSGSDAFAEDNCLRRTDESIEVDVLEKKIGWILNGNKLFADNNIFSTSKHFDKYDKCNFSYGSFVVSDSEKYGQFVITQPGIYKIKLSVKGNLTLKPYGSSTYDTFKNVRLALNIRHFRVSSSDEEITEIPLDDSVEGFEMSSEDITKSFDSVKEFSFELSENNLYDEAWLSVKDKYVPYAFIAPCLMTDTTSYSYLFKVTEMPEISVVIEPVAYEIPCDISCEYTLTSNKNLQVDLKSSIYNYATDCAIVSAGIIYSYDCTSLVAARAKLIFDDKGSDYKMKTYSYSATTTGTNTTETDEQFTLSIPTDESKLWATGFAQIRYNDGDSTKTRTRVVYTEPFKVEVV